MCILHYSIQLQIIVIYVFINFYNNYIKSYTNNNREDQSIYERGHKREYQLLRILYKLTKKTLNSYLTSHACYNLV